MLPGVGLGRYASVVEGFADGDDLCAERAHPLDLAGVRVAGGEDDGRDAEGSRGVGDALAEVPRRHAGDGSVRTDPPLPRQPVRDEPRAAALERADRVDGLDLDDDWHAERARQAVVDVLRRAGEGGVDRAVRGADGRGFELGDADHGSEDPGRGPGKQKRPKEPLVRSHRR